MELQFKFKHILFQLVAKFLIFIHFFNFHLNLYFVSFYLDFN